MKITILCVGKLKEKYLKDGMTEYAKRLSRYCKLDFIEVSDEKTPDGASDVMKEKIRQTEGERLLRHVKDTDYCIALAIDGKMPDSVQLSSKIKTLGVGGISHIVFVIGGSLGLSKDVQKRANEAVSFSKLTFPHQLMRLILLEQIYRSFRIMQGEPYHK